MNKDILALQKLLNKYENCRLVEDGIYGQSTSRAVDEYLNINNKGGVICEPKTENFCLKEYYSGAIVSGKRISKAVKPPKKYYGNIQRSMDRLEVLRSELGGMPIIINSGYRTQEYNGYVNGAENSAHLRGSAADIIVKGVHPKDVYAAAGRLYPEGGVGLYDTFVHVDLDTEVKRPARW